MKAISYARYGGPEVLEYGDVDDPKVGPDTVLVRVRAASVNPVDWKARQGHLDAILPTVFPVVPGWDVAGVVVRPGPAVPEFAAGDEVIGYVRQDVLSGGTFAEYVAAPVRTLAPKPRGLTFEEAAGIPWPGSPRTRCCTASSGCAGARPSWCTRRPAGSDPSPSSSPPTSAPGSSARRANATTTSCAASAPSR